MNYDLFESPVSQTKVREGVYAYRYRNGTINIKGQKYIDYTMREAISLWRKANPYKR